MNTNQAWILQQDLIGVAEELMGPRSLAFRLRAPTFQDGGPRLRFSPDLSEVWVELSRNAAGYWPTLVFELAHETIHLLDPVIGYTNFLEEGVATHFQFLITPKISGVEIPVTLESYRAAQSLVLELGSRPFEVARLVRARCGALGRASAEDLWSLFPFADSGVIESLVSTCIPR